MLQTLHIKNFVLIDEMTIDFSSGFNVFTGETGAGKSMIIDGLSIILGSRALREKVRNERDFALIEATFLLDGNQEAQSLLREFAIDFSDIITVKRIIYTGKPSEVFLNDRKVTVEKATALVNTLVSIISQHSSQALLNRDHHLALLDGYGDTLHHELLEKMKTTYQAWYALNQELQSMVMDEESRRREMDLLLYQQKEIDTFGLENFSEEKLLEALSRVEHMAEIKRAYESLGFSLSGDDTSSGILSLLSETLRDCRHAATYDTTLNQLLDRFASTTIELQDISSELQREAMSLYVDEDELHQLQERRDALYALKSKYGRDLEAVKAFYDKTTERLRFLEEYELNRDTLKRKVNHAYQVALEAAEQLSRSRNERIVFLESGLVKELQRLDLPYAQFKVHKEQGPLQYTGQDTIYFLISTNIGENLRPVEMVASGGELSRMTLAMNSLLHERHNGFTMIYDEIDTGISGHAAKVVGEALKRLSQHMQILTITHLPQIAALGDSHYHVQKEIVDGRTVTSLTKLSKDERLEELAHMVGGGVAFDAIVEEMKSFINES